MKNGKKPTLQQKKQIRESGLRPESWLVIKNTKEYLEIVSRMELKKIGNRRVRTRKIYK